MATCGGEPAFGSRAGTADEAGLHCSALVNVHAPIESESGEVAGSVDGVGLPGIGQATID